MSADVGDANGRMVDFDLHLRPPSDAESVAPPDRPPSDGAYVAPLDRPPSDGASVAPPDRPPSDRESVAPALSSAGSVGSNELPLLERLDRAPLSQHPQESALAPPSAPPSASPSSPEADLGLGPPVQQFGYVSPPAHQGEAHGQTRARPSDSPVLDSPAPQRRRLSDPDQSHPLSDGNTAHSTMGHQGPKDEVPNENGNEPPGSGAPPSSPPPAPTSAVPSFSTFKLEMSHGTNSSTGFKSVKAYALGSTGIMVEFICDCDYEYKETMEVRTNNKMKDKRVFECGCEKRYTVELTAKKFSLSCCDGKKKERIGHVSALLACR